MKILTALLFSFALFTATAQRNTDPQLQDRLNDYLRLTKEMNFDKAFDFMHPKLFTIASKEDLVKITESAFQNPDFSFSFDSLAILSVGQPVKIGAETYRKITYYTKMIMTLNSDSMNLKEEGFASAITASMKNGFSGKKVVLDREGNRIFISGTDIMFAIKDSPKSDWLFLGYEPKNPALIKKLFPPAVRQRFGL